MDGRHGCRSDWHRRGFGRRQRNLLHRAVALGKINRQTNFACGAIGLDGRRCCDWDCGRQLLCCLPGNFVLFSRKLHSFLTLSNGHAIRFGRVFRSCISRYFRG